MAASWSTRMAASSSAARSATSARRSGSTTASASARRLGARPTSPGRSLAVTGACMYITRAVLDEVGLFDEAYPMAYEDVDLCLRAWQAGFKVWYAPAARARAPGVDHPGQPRSVSASATSQRVFWERWGEFFDDRNVRTGNGKLRVIYVTEDTGVGGGHRDIFEHLNGLLERGHEVELWSLGKAARLVRPARTGADVRGLRGARRGAGAGRGDQGGDMVEHRQPGLARRASCAGSPSSSSRTSRRATTPTRRGAERVLAWYRHEFRYMTISSWNRDRLRELGLDAVADPTGDRPGELPAAGRTSSVAPT